MSLLKSKKAIKVMGVVAVLAFIAARAFYLNLPKNVIALDINPSIELHTNSFGRVVSVEPINDDAKTLMAGYELKDKDLENVIEDIVNRLFLNGYLTSERTNEILVSADASGQSDQLLNEVNTVIDDYVAEKQLDVQLLQQKLDVDKEETKEAHNNHVSVGKMAIINKLMETNQDLSVEELSHKSVKELMQYFEDQNITVGDIVKEYASRHKQAPSVTGTAGDFEDATDASENLDTISDATVTPASEDLDDAEENDSDSHKNHTKEVRSSDAAKSAEDADHDSDENGKKTSTRKSHTYHNTAAVVKNNLDTDEEDNQDQDSINDNDDADEDDKYYDSKKSDSSIREDNDSQQGEDSDFDEDSDRGDNHYLSGDREDREDGQEDGNNQGEDNEDGNHQGYEYGDED